MALRTAQGHGTRQAKVAGCNFTECTFGKADLTGADLSYCDLTGAGLVGAKLDGTNFDGAKLKDTIVDFADLKGAKGITGVMKAQMKIVGSSGASL